MTRRSSLALVSELETRLHLELLPGTEVMTDVGGIHFVHNHQAGHAGNAGVVLIPQPSQDRHDPLNWSPFWKLAAVLNQGAFVLISVMALLSIAPLTPIYVHEWNATLPKVALLTGSSILVLGYANFILIPLSNIFGRRSISLVCSLICVIANAWQAFAGSYNSFLGARILVGFGAAINETIMTVVIADVIFLHERGAWIGLYFWCYFIGLFIGPIISGTVASRYSWRWFFWICTILQAISFLCMIFLFPETKFKRGPVEPTKALATDVEGSQPSSERKLEVECVQADASNTTAQDWLHQGAPSREQFRAIAKADPEVMKYLFLDVITPLRILFVPIILWASFTLGFAANLLLNLNLTQSQVFAAPPYNFLPASVGLVNLALVGGGMVGLLTAGPLSDWVSMRATRKNGGIREPEMRLPAISIYVVGCLVGSVIVAIGYQRSWPWEVIVVLGFGLGGLQVVAIPTIAITYAIDCYSPITGQILVIGTVCKNTFGFKFGMTYFINDWAAEKGFIGPIMLLGGLTVGTSTIGAVVFYFWGKTFRRWTKDSRLHKLNL